MDEHTIFDWSRKARTGVPEVVFAEGKTVEQIDDILMAHHERSAPLLTTRLTPEQMAHLGALTLPHLSLDPLARLASHRAPIPAADAPEVAVVCAGTSDLPVAREALLSARFLGLRADLICDVGVAGLWRLEQHLPTLTRHRVVIAVAGMEGALFSVLGGLLPGAIIAVPTSVGYGVGAQGKAALSSALSSCAPGVLTVNIDNGFGAAAAAAKILRPPQIQSDNPSG
ncbi:hypothetical protein SAMN04488030_0132 [Aliiroseovarius halocynthiae]|uniref:Nickel pincer cofactor biosynthesis protein LarB n=1 Tax=Aliiroseovarius halocynthiae TaxID=985055 RepID=A0A545SL69_9RHOB|nr:nickel pincer cofactor biosynthesis protein LarB [Aliiroseovarius halocynthiae]TQV65727.1 nickel pincer cofactor biosynthesis protein LarB [Aliiroseovarius halocynthiae]SMR83983.1 hypothetical protein SAMN04488030_0132 [Aliiroseovarius halocynthiae]